MWIRVRRGIWGAIKDDGTYHYWAKYQSQSDSHWHCPWTWTIQWRHSVRGDRRACQTFAHRHRRFRCCWSTDCWRLCWCSSCWSLPWPDRQPPLPIDRFRCQCQALRPPSSSWGWWRPRRPSASASSSRMCSRTGGWACGTGCGTTAAGTCSRALLRTADRGSSSSTWRIRPESPLEQIIIQLNSSKYQETSHFLTINFRFKSNLTLRWT